MVRTPAMYGRPLMPGERWTNRGSRTGNAGNGVTGAAAVLPDGQCAALRNSAGDLGGGSRRHGGASFTPCQRERRKHNRHNAGGSGSRGDGYAFAPVRRSQLAAMASAATRYATPAGIHMINPASC